MATITTRSRSSNIVTLVIDAPVFTGDVTAWATVAGVDHGMDGEHLATAVDADTLTYRDIGPDVSAGAPPSGATVVAALNLTPARVEELTGVKATGDRPVTVDHINLAHGRILYDTDYTPTGHRDVREIPELDVEAAWAVVAGRVRGEMRRTGNESVISEGQDGYSQSQDPSIAVRFMGNPMEGYPRTMLRRSPVQSFHVRPGDVVYR